MRLPIFLLAVVNVILLTVEPAEAREKGDHHRSRWREKLMEEHDTDGDGNLNEEERRSMKKAWAGKWEDRRSRWSKIRKQYDTEDEDNPDEEERGSMKKSWAGKRKERWDARSRIHKNHHQDGDDRSGSERHDLRKAWGKRGRSDFSGRLMTHLDANKDGEISIEEVPERFRKHFKHVDLDASGTVNRREMRKACHKARTKFLSHFQQRVFDKFDRNNDGRLDIDKIIAWLHATMDRIDTSDDGFIDRSEFKAMTSPPLTKQDASEQLKNVQAELVRLSDVLEKLAESLQHRK
ncbi:MAG: EF-hand domain-containing protein [Fuerstiella sp.]|nr:EF-hand domain-containing protein [Fuerstiella sp.]